MTAEISDSVEPKTSRINRLGKRLGPYEVTFLVLTAVTIIVRLINVGEKPFHHDESLHAWFAWKIVTGQEYTYDPVYHGPVQFYLMSLSYLTMGVGDFAARVPPVLVGSLLVGFPYFLRRELTKAGALVTSILLMISPSFFYYGRFVREDIYTACWTLALIVGLFGFLRNPRPWHPPLVLGILAVSFATKESTFITVFIVGCFLIGLFFAQGWRQPLRSTPLVTKVASLGSNSWLWGVAVFMVVFTLLFTSGLTNLPGLFEGAFGGLRYWLGQHPVNRGSQPWYYYLVLLIGYEWPVTITALAGVVVALRRRTSFDVFLVWYLVSSVALYSWAGERMPWLVLHPLLPAILLAGRAIGEAWKSRGRLPGRIGIAAFGTACIYLAVSAIGLSYLRQADPRELLIYVQSSDELREVRDEVMALDEQLKETRGDGVRIGIDSSLSAAWPWAWYLRDVQATYVDMSTTTFDPKDSDVLLVIDEDHRNVQGSLAGFERRPYHHRIWWVPEYLEGSPREWLTWMTTREPFSETGGVNAWIYVRDDL